MECLFSARDFSKKFRRSGELTKFAQLLVSAKAGIQTEVLSLHSDRFSPYL